jgi:hypothetical protein
VSHARLRGPIVIDTDVFSADLVPGAPLADRYAPMIARRPALISFQTAAELRYGALRRGWGEARMLRLEAKIQRAEIVQARARTKRPHRRPLMQERERVRELVSVHRAPDANPR